MTNKNLNINYKGVDENSATMLPVKSGQVIKSGTICGVQAGFIVDGKGDVTVSSYVVIKDIGFYQEPKATTQDGDINDPNLIAGDKTCRSAYNKGEFLLGFNAALTEADVDKEVYVVDNNTLTVTGTTGDVVFGKITTIVDDTTAYVEINKNAMNKAS